MANPYLEPHEISEDKARAAEPINARLLAMARKIVNDWHADDANFERELDGTPEWLALARRIIAEAEAQPKPVIYALLSNQGTACDETALSADEYTAENRARIEAAIDPENPDAPVPGTWTDCSGNEALQPDPDRPTYDELLDGLAALELWACRMGGWESEVWQDTRDLLRRAGREG